MLQTRAGPGGCALLLPPSISRAEPGCCPPQSPADAWHRPVTPDFLRQSRGRCHRLFRPDSWSGSWPPIPTETCSGKACGGIPSGRLEAKGVPEKDRAAGPFQSGSLADPGSRMAEGSMGCWAGQKRTFLALSGPVAAGAARGLRCTSLTLRRSRYPGPDPSPLPVRAALARQSPRRSGMPNPIRTYGAFHPNKASSKQRPLSPSMAHPSRDPRGETKRRSPGPRPE